MVELGSCGVNTQQRWQWGSRLTNRKMFNSTTVLTRETFLTCVWQRC